MVALIAWLLPGAHTSRVLVVMVITYFIGLGKLAHVIACSAEVAFPAWLGELKWSEYWFGYLTPALLGNAVGEVLLAALLNHLQVEREHRTRPVD